MRELNLHKNNQQNDALKPEVLAKCVNEEVHDEKSILNK